MLPFLHVPLYTLQEIFKETGDMSVRRAEDKDIPRLKELLLQVLNIHAEGRPDIFIPNTTKYSDEELREMIRCENTPVFVDTDAQDNVIGYAMCIVQHRLHSSNMTDIITVFIDDLCVDQNVRHSGCGRRIYDAVKDYALSIGAYHITLNVWTCNPSAIAFYESVGLSKMEYVMEEIL